MGGRVAQLDRALASGARGRGFESRSAHHFFNCLKSISNKKDKKALDAEAQHIHWQFYLFLVSKNSRCWQAMWIFNGQCSIKIYQSFVMAPEDFWHHAIRQSWANHY